jgi:hypothetical protein
LTTPLSDLLAQTAPTEGVSLISSLTLAPGNSENLYLATRYGLLQAEPSGMASLVQGIEGNLASLVAHPDEVWRLLASGCGLDGGTLGVMVSADGGVSWSRITEGIDGPVAFLALEFSRVDPDIVYGASDSRVQISRDGGSSWTMAGKPPADIFDLAASSLDGDTVYVATPGGIFGSRDGGGSWQPGHTNRAPATMVYTAPGGRHYAFVLCAGLIAASEPGLTGRPCSRTSPTIISSKWSLIRPIRSGFTPAPTPARS